MAPKRDRTTQRVLNLVGGLAAGIAVGGLIYLGFVSGLSDSNAAVDSGFDRLEIARGDLPRVVVASGVTEPKSRVVVQSEISGLVSKVRVQEGDRVERDELLVELDKQQLEDRVAAQRAALRRLRALARMRLVERARLERDEQKRRLDRHLKLSEKGVISERALQDSQYSYEMARIAVNDAIAELEARRAAVDEAEKILDRFERDLTKSSIRSPSDGVVESLPVEVGTAVAGLEYGGAVTVVATIADDEKIHVVAQVDENDIASVRKNQTAVIRIDALSGEEFEGTLRKISLAGTRYQSVSDFEVEIEIAGDERIRVGMSADVRIVVDDNADVVLVPNLALVRSASGIAVRVARRDGSGSFDFVPVVTDYSDGFQTVIKEGIAEGDVVLVHNGQG